MVSDLWHMGILGQESSTRIVVSGRICEYVFAEVSLCLNGGCGPFGTNYSRVPLWRGPIYHDIIHGIAMTGAELRSDFTLTTDTANLVLTGELGGAYSPISQKNFP